MAKAIVRTASVMAIAAILISLVGTVVMAETTVAARSSKWECRTFPVCTAKSGKVVPVFWRIHVTNFTNTTLTFSVNSSVYKEYYPRVQFAFVSWDK